MRYMLLGLLLGCASAPDTSSILSAPLWDPTGLVHAGDRLYIPLPHDGGLAIVQPDAPARHLALGEGYIRSLQPVPGGDKVLATTDATRCVSVDTGWYEASCPPADDPSLGSLFLISEDETTLDASLGPWYGEFSFSDDGRYAIASLDPNADTTGGGIVNLTSLFVVDLLQGQTWEIAVGFEATRVLFTGDTTTGTTGAIVLSRSEVALLDLADQATRPEVVYPLALDPDVLIEPVDVALTPSQRHALISVQNSSDLYVLDLESPSVNIVSLAGRPTAMAVSETTDQTVLVHHNARVEILNHDRFDTIELPLDEAMSAVEIRDGIALLYSTTGRLDAYRLDLTDLRLSEYRLNWPARAVHVAPDFSFAVALSNTSPPRMEVMDLTDGPDGVDTEPRRFSLDGTGLDVAFHPQDDQTQILLLQADQATLYQLSWPSLQAEPIALSSPPERIGPWSDGGFWVTHRDPLGRVSFFRPGQPVQQVEGFGRFGLLEPHRTAEAP